MSKVPYDIQPLRTRPLPPLPQTGQSETNPAAVRERADTSWEEEEGVRERANTAWEEEGVRERANTAWEEEGVRERADTAWEEEREREREIAGGANHDSYALYATVNKKGIRKTAPATALPERRPTQTTPIDPYSGESQTDPIDLYEELDFTSGITGIRGAGQSNDYVSAIVNQAAPNNPAREMERKLNMQAVLTRNTIEDALSSLAKKRKRFPRLPSFINRAVSKMTPKEDVKQDVLNAIGLIDEVLESISVFKKTNPSINLFASLTPDLFHSAFIKAAFLFINDESLLEKDRVLVRDGEGYVRNIFFAGIEKIPNIISSSLVSKESLVFTEALKDAINSSRLEQVSKEEFLQSIDNKLNSSITITPKTSQDQRVEGSQSSLGYYSSPALPGESNAFDTTQGPGEATGYHGSQNEKSDDYESSDEYESLYETVTAVRQPERSVLGAAASPVSAHDPRSRNA